MDALRRLGAAVLVAAWIASPARAADEGLVLRQSAERLAASGRCEEAIARARRARELAPSDARAAAVEGRCAIALKRYAEAVAPLEAARRLDPSLPGVSADLAMAHYHRGDPEAARRELAVAGQESPGDPKVLLYRGLLHLEASEHAEAAGALERAARASSEIDPLASYYASLAWQQARERDKARAALEGVVARSPSSPWADEARAALARMDAAGAAFGAGPWWVSASAGVEWDDNVVLRGDEVSLPSDISDEDDVRGFWMAEAGVELFRTEGWAGGALAGYYGNAHADLHAFDQQSPSASLWLDRRIGERSFLRLQPYFGYTWLSTDPYVMHAGGVLSYHHGFADAGAGRVYGQYGYRDYMYNTTSPRVFDVFGKDVSEERDHDGTWLRVGYDHAVSVTESTTLRAGIAHGRYEAEGAEYSHVSYGGHAGVTQALPADFLLDVEGSYDYEPYRQESTFPVPFPQPGYNSAKRRDNVWSARVLLERPITDWLTVAAHYRYVDNDSNTPVFDYDRNIIGGYFTVHYGP
jgi:tetratricopeptide (TPR) repeat protein